MRVAVWGLGPHAFKSILPSIELSPLLELAGVWSRDATRRAEATRKWGGTPWPSSAEMLASSEVDVVYVATPTGLHFEHGMEVLGANKHLVCEKSLAVHPAHAFMLVAEARARKLVLCEALMFQHHPRTTLLESVIRGPDFGKPLHAFCAFGLPPLQHPGFRNDVSLGGGALLDVGCYPLCMMRVLLGSDPRVGHAEMSGGAGDGVDIAGSACLEFASGARANVAWGYNRAYTAELIAVGEHQSVYANRLFAKETLDDSSIVLRDQTGGQKTLNVPPANGFVSMFEWVVRGIADPMTRERLYEQAEDQARLMSDVMKCAK